MRFRFFFSGLLVLSFLFQSSKFIFAESFSKPHVLGAIIRPQMLEKVFETYASEIPLQGCIGAEEEQWEIDAKISAKPSQLVWLAESNEILVVTVNLSQSTIVGKVRPECKNENRKFIEFEGGIEKMFSLQIRIHPKEGEIRVEIDPLSWKEAMTHLKIRSLSNSAVNPILELQSARESFSLLVQTQINEVLSKWILGKLRNFSFVESVTDLLQRSAMWGLGVDVKDGSIQLKNQSPRITDREIAFALFPRNQGNIFVSDRQLEIYSNAAFIDETEMTQILGESRTPYNKSIRVDQLKRRLTQTMRYEDSPFTRPLIGKRDADFSLLVSEDLINNALQSIYSQDLLEFVAQIDLGSQVKGLLTKISPQVGIRVGLGSNSVPQIRFKANQLNLSVTDYSLSLGTFLEDRLIPSTRIQASVNISSQLVVNARTQTVNLKLDAETFKIQLGETDEFRPKLTDQDLRLMERLANEIWKTFFRKYPELVLFPTLFEAEGSQLDVSISGIEIFKDKILIHLNLENRK